MDAGQLSTEPRGRSGHTRAQTRAFAARAVKLPTCLPWKTWPSDHGNCQSPALGPRRLLVDGSPVDVKVHPEPSREKLPTARFW